MRSPASEEQLWSYLVQLTAALRAVHGAALALRPAALAPSKVASAGCRQGGVGCGGQGGVEARDVGPSE